MSSALITTSARETGRVNRRRLLLSPLLLLVAVPMILTGITVSGRSAHGTGMRARAIPAATQSAVGQPSGEMPARVGRLRQVSAVSVSATGVATEAGQFWPDTPEELDAMLGITGTRVPDGSTTPGRGKVIWDLPSGKRITSEAYPYHTDALAFHREPHFHVDEAGAKSHSPSGRRPGDPFDC